MYNDIAPILTGICTAAVLMLIEHLIARHLDFRLRYVLGMLAYLIGFASWAWRTGDWTAWRAGVLIAVGSGSLVLLAYLLRWFWKRELWAAQEAARIEGRVQEANKHATGVARTRDD